MTPAGGARLFVALDPPSAVCEQLAVWARQALRGQGERVGAAGSLRVLDAELLHLTLCFLGSRPMEEVAAIAEAVRGCPGRVGRLGVGAPLWLPPRRPRALAVEIHDDPHGGLEALHGALVGALAHACSFREERRRRFRAHITLARIRGRPPGATRLPGAREPLAATPGLSFAPQALVLYRSWLSPAGATYEALERRAL